MGIKPVGDEGATGGGFIFQRKENPMTSFFRLNTVWHMQLTKWKLQTSIRLRGGL
jgi:hypothetical protein